mgnify:CR=1 FL=1
MDGCFVDEETITCQTPNYEQQGANEVDIKLNIGDAGWTVNKITFSYFENTSSKNCLAYGPGLLPQVLYGIEMPFIIQVTASIPKLLWFTKIVFQRPLTQWERREQVEKITLKCLWLVKITNPPEWLRWWTMTMGHMKFTILHHCLGVI